MFAVEPPLPSRYEKPSSPESKTALNPWMPDPDRQPRSLPWQPFADTGGISQFEPEIKTQCRNPRWMGADSYRTSSATGFRVARRLTNTMPSPTPASASTSCSVSGSPNSATPNTSANTGVRKVNDDMVVAG